VQSFQEFQKLPIFFVHAENFTGVLCAQIRQQYRALLSQGCNSTAHRHAMRTALLVPEALDQQRFHFR